MKELDQIGGDLHEFIRVPALLRDEQKTENGPNMLQKQQRVNGQETAMTMTTNFDFLGSTNMSKAQMSSTMSNFGATIKHRTMIPKKTQL